MSAWRWALLAFCGLATVDAGEKRYSCAEAKDHDEIVFDCGGDFISKVIFSSYGTPTGHCEDEDQKNSFKTSKCHSGRSEDVIQERCLGQTTCMFTVTDEQFGGDPCPGKNKRLLARVACGDHKKAEEAMREAEKKRGLSSSWKFIIGVGVVFSVYCVLGVAFNVRKACP